MATEVGRAVVPVTFDKDQIGRDLSSGIEGGAKQSEGHISSTFKRIAGIATAAFAGVQVIGFVKDSIDAAREANKVAAQTEAVIASTGGAAGLTADQFSKLAESISRKTGIDDEQIQSAENLLATFTNLKDSVGDGNDIFSQATKIAVDMGAALGGDASSNAIQLGKALQDPVKGITALTRVGVSFTDEQKAQIKTMQEHGDMAGAQKVILAELNKEFGGSAEATATAGAKWGVFWGNLQEKFGNLLIPVLDAVAEWAMTTLPNAFGVLQDAIGPVVEDVIGGISQIVGVLFEGDFKGGGPFAEDSELIDGLFRFRDVMIDDVFPIIKQVGEWMRDHWQPILAGIAIAFGVIAAPVATLTIGLIVLYTRSRTFRDIVEATRVGLVKFGEGVVQVAGWLSDNLGPTLASIGASMADFARFFSDRWEKIRTAIMTVLTALKIQIAIFLAPIMLAWTYFHDQILAVVHLVWDQIAGVISTTIRIISDVFDVVISLLSGDWAGAWDAAKDIPAAFVDYIKGTLANLLTFVIDFFSSLPGNILSALGDLASLLINVGSSLLSGLVNGVTAGAVALWDWLISLPGAILGLMIEAPGWLYNTGRSIGEGLLHGLLDMFGTVFSWLTGLPARIVAAIGDLSSTLIGVGADLVGGFLGGVRDALIGGVDDSGFYATEAEARAAMQAGGARPDSRSAHAQGGIFDRATWGMFGEAGREVILPLSDYRRTWQLAQQSGLLDVLARGAGIHRMDVGAALQGAGGRGTGNTYQLGGGDVFVQHAEDAVAGMRRVELLAGVV